MPTYAEKQKSTYETLAEKGQSMSVRTRPTRAVNKSTGVMTVSGVAVDYDTYGLITKVNNKKQGDSDVAGYQNINGSQIGMKVALIMVANYDPVLETEIAVEVTPSMKLVIDSKEHEILDVMPFRPGGVTIFYDVQVAL